MFPQNDPRQYHSNRGIERSDDDRFIETAALAGINEKGAGGDVQESRQNTKDGRSKIESYGGPGGDNSNCSSHERCDATNRGNKNCRPFGLVHTEVEGREPDTCQRSHRNALGMASLVVFSLRLRPGDQPDSDYSQTEAGDGPATGSTFQGHIDEGRNGCPNERRDGSRESHLTRGQGAVKDGE
jgi:hypothetical protein